jgi:putative transposase
MEDWENSSFRDYLGLRIDTICNLELSKTRLNINFDKFYTESYSVIDFNFEE